MQITRPMAHKGDEDDELLDDGLELSPVNNSLNSNNFQNDNQSNKLMSDGAN